MKQIKKLLLAGAGALLLGGGVVLNYFQTQPKEQLSGLMLANIEALGHIEEGAGTITCSGGDNKCADAYDKDGNIIATLTMP